MYRLMIVDDEQLERIALRQIIENNIAMVKVAGEAKNGEEAIDLAKDIKPHIILMDIKMPEMSGLEASQEIKKIIPEVKIIVLSAFDSFDYAQLAVKVGVCDYLLKPIRPKKVLAVIEKLISEMQEEKKEIQNNKKVKEQLSQIWPFLKTSFIYDILHGNIVSEEEMQERGRIIGFKLMATVVCLANIDNFLKVTRNMDELGRQLLKQNIFNIISGTFANIKNIEIAPFMSDKIIILVGENNMNEDKLIEYCRSNAMLARDRIEKELKVTVTIGIGNYYKDVTKIRQSYIEAVTAQRQGSFMGKNQVIQYNDLLMLKSYKFFYPFEEEEKLLAKVRFGDMEGALQNLQHLWQDIIQKNLSEELQKACAVELLVVLYRAAISGGADLKQMAMLNLAYIDELTSCNNSAELGEWLNNIVRKFIEKVNGGRMNSTKALVQLAKEYISNNYSKDITLEEVAGHLHFGPYYLSRVFKKVEGITFKRYVIRIKMEAAKKKLIVTQNPISHIAREVGYEDISYFSRMFKKEEGMSPKEYRNKIKS